MKLDLFIERYSHLLEQGQFLLKETMVESINPYRETISFFRWLLPRLGQIGICMTGALVGVWFGGKANNLTFPTDLLFQPENTWQFICGIIYALLGLGTSLYFYGFGSIRYQRLIRRPKWSKSRIRRFITWLLTAIGIYILISIIIAVFYPGHILSFWASLWNSFEFVFNFLLLIVMGLFPVVMVVVYAFPGIGLWAAQSFGNWKSNNTLPLKVTSALVTYLQEKFPCDEMDLCISTTSIRLEKHRYKQTGVEISTAVIGVLIAVSAFIPFEDILGNVPINKIYVFAAFFLIWLWQVIQLKTLSAEEYQVYACIQEACLLTKQISERKEKQKTVERNPLETGDLQHITAPIRITRRNCMKVSMKTRRRSLG